MRMSWPRQLEPHVGVLGKFFVGESAIDGNTARRQTVLIERLRRAKVRGAQKRQPIGVRVVDVHDAKAGEPEILRQGLAEPR